MVARLAAPAWRAALRDTESGHRTDRLHRYWSHPTQFHPICPTAPGSRVRREALTNEVKENLTMVSYKDLDTLTGKLKRSAIDAYMKSEGWRVHEHKYEIDSRGTDSTVTRPASDGSGGGDWEATDSGDLWGLTDRDEEFTTAFDDIRSAIDDVLKPWTWIPGPGKIETLVEDMQEVTTKLHLGDVRTEDGTVTGKSEIAGNLTLILENSTAMSGSTFATFKSKFLSQLGVAIGGQHAISVILGGALAAQQKVWDGARQTVADTVDAATRAFDAYAHDEGSVDWGVVLQVVGYAASAAIIFAGSGGAAVPVSLSVAGLGLTILNDAVSDDQTDGSEPSSYDYDGIWWAFKNNLAFLNLGIGIEEATLRGNLTDNLSVIRGDQGSYDLSRPSLLDVDDASALGEDKAVVLEPPLVAEITDTYLPAVAKELRAAQDKVDTATDSGAFLRDADIGVSEYGPNPEYEEARWLLWELLGNLAWEVEVSAKHLDLAVEDIQNADGASQSALEKHTEQLGEDSSYVPDPWNDPEHGPGTTGL